MTREEIRKDIRKGTTVYDRALSYQGKKRLYTAVDTNGEQLYEDLENRLIDMVLKGER